MKKLILSIFFSILVFSSFAMQATVVSAKGKTEVQNGGSWVALKVGDAIEQGAVIQTGFKSELVLKIKESTVTVAPLSRITLQTLVEREGLNGAAGKDETAIFLDTGSLKSNVQKSADRRVGFTVRSPVATASVRGTKLDTTTKYKALDLKVSGGHVAFWKNTRNSEKTLDNASVGPVGEAPQGNEPGDISEYAPANAIIVSKGEGAAVAAGGGMKSPVNMAHEHANSLGFGTRSAAAGERADRTDGFGPAFGHGAVGGGAPSSSGTGSLVVEVGFKEE